MKEPMTKFAVDMLDEVAQECEQKAVTAAGERQRALRKAAERLPDIMSKLVDMQEDYGRQHKG
jgi:hypothetical protein